MKNQPKPQTPSKPQGAPSNQKNEQASRREENPRRKGEQSIEKDIEKRTQENRTPKGENL